MAEICPITLPVFDKGTRILFVVRDCGGTPDANGILPLVDITNATLLTIVFNKGEDATTPVITRTGTVYTGGTNGDGTDGVIEYVTVGTEVDSIGGWQAECVVAFDNSVPPAEHSSSIVDIDVVATLRYPAD